MFYALLIKGQRFRHIIEYAYKVHNDTAGLVVGIFAVGAADGLQECMVLHWFVEIHTLQDRCIKACEQFGCDNHEAQWRQWVAELVEHAFLVVA